MCFAKKASHLNEPQKVTFSGLTGIMLHPWQKDSAVTIVITPVCYQKNLGCKERHDASLKPVGSSVGEGFLAVGEIWPFNHPLHRSMLVGIKKERCRAFASESDTLLLNLT